VTGAVQEVLQAFLVVPLVHLAQVQELLAILHQGEVGWNRTQGSLVEVLIPLEALLDVGSLASRAG